MTRFWRLELAESARKKGPAGTLGCQPDPLTVKNCCVPWWEIMSPYLGDYR